MHLVAVLHDVRSAHNVGSIFRTADAAGFQKIICCGITPTPLDRFGKTRDDVAKVALGAERSVPWEYAATTLRAIDELKKGGYRIFAVEQSRRSVPYYRARIAASSRVALVLGNEVRGLPRTVLARADRVLEIPMFGVKESLNVAVAFGIVAFSCAKMKR